MINLIINADDFGWDENRTKAILEAAHLGLITTTTAMTNMPWFETAIERAKGTPLYDNIGLHLCLTEGRPLTEKIRKSPLFCDDRGNFNGVFHRSLKTRLLLPAYEQEAVREEAEAQMHRYLDMGLPLRHLDSHHHSHTDYSIARIVMPLAERLGFQSVRMSRNFGLALSPAKRLYKAFVNPLLRKHLPFHADCFCSFADLVSMWDCLPNNAVVEVMVHPLYRKGASGELDLKGELMDHRSPLSNLASFLSLEKQEVKIMTPINH